MDRRAFVATALALPAIAPGLARSLQRNVGPRDAARLRFGCAAITWGGRDDVAIADIAALGYRGIQLRTAAVERWGTRPQELRDLLAGKGLAFVALSSGTLRLDPATFDDDMALHTRHARFLRDAGGSFLQVVDERPRGREPAAGDFASMGERLSELGRRVEDLGVAVAYHNHMGNLGQAPHEVESVLAASDSTTVRLLLDIAHYHAAGGDPAAAVRQHSDRLAFLHLKDLQRITPASAGRSSHRFVELGQGEVAVPAVMRALQDVSFDGWGIVELDAVTAATRTARDCAQVSKDYLASIGYRI